MRLSNRLICLLFNFIVVHVGCGRDARLPDLVPVEGVVLLDGIPLRGATIAFLPAGETAGRGGGAMTNDAGAYSVEEQDGTLGAAIGSYRVVISKLVNPDGSDFTGERLGPMDTDARELLPAKYSDMGLTELTAEVSATSGHIDFALFSDPQ